MIDISLYHYWSFIKEFHQRYPSDQRRTPAALAYLFTAPKAMDPFTQALIIKYIEKVNTHAV